MTTTMMKYQGEKLRGRCCIATSDGREQHDWVLRCISTQGIAEVERGGEIRYYLCTAIVDPIRYRVVRIA